MAMVNMVNMVDMVDMVDTEDMEDMEMVMPMNMAMWRRNRSCPAEVVKFDNLRSWKPTKAEKNQWWKFSSGGFKDFLFSSLLGEDSQLD